MVYMLKFHEVPNGQGTQWLLQGYEMGGTKWLGYEMTIIHLNILITPDLLVFHHLKQFAR